MIYSAEILEIDFSDDYEGRLWLRCNSQKLLVAHQIPLDGSSKYLIPGQTLYIDLWLFYANPMHSLLPQKQIPKSLNVVGGVLHGQVEQIFSSNEFRIDCGELKIDVLSESSIKKISKRDYIEVSGSYYIFLPGTEYSKEELWG